LARPGGGRVNCGPYIPIGGGKCLGSGGIGKAWEIGGEARQKGILLGFSTRSRFLNHRLESFGRLFCGQGEGFVPIRADIIISYVAMDDKKSTEE